MYQASQLGSSWGGCGGGPSAAIGTTRGGGLWSILKSSFKAIIFFAHGALLLGFNI